MRACARPASLVTAGCALALALALAGCGEEDILTPPRSQPGAPGSGGALGWAVPEPVSELDPLHAASRTDQLVTRQIHEPLVATVAAPLGDVRRLPGLALSHDSSVGDTVWSFRLRPGVRFQDGSRLNAGAVRANGNRWLTTPEGRALMPQLFAVDAPRPDLVRFLLREPDPDFPELLSDPRTGIVSPKAMTEETGSGAELRREERSGAGPFELRERDSTETLVARNASWWGSRRDLGPALDQVRFRVVADGDERVALLAAGEVEVADSLGMPQAEEAGDEPLVEVLGGPGGALALERSVRGIASATEIPSLSGVWLTTVGEG